ncbi:uncharacterized protein E0L32_008035 [Thyridium curvatum]|uniref:Histone chaperone domain-containing protein n=1 Tax=Thyridium curvatum TaxID=1093900 RepID=A0A507B1Z3_9PEZI|nr:uncharacterized protein E0L32_008035 [Thyridium curvatum]TPX10998.1 hypothetical protein E0L32_008035 [Thyridium curvatum]
MADHQNGDSTMAQDPTNAQGGEFAESKGKGKAVASEQDLKGDTAMDEDDDDDEDEDAAENDDDDDDAEDDDDMQEIDLDNVVGRRTRGKVIDFAKAAEENPAPEDEDDEDEDDDFEDPDNSKMDED